MIALIILLFVRYIAKPFCIFVESTDNCNSLKHIDNPDDFKFLKCEAHCITYECKQCRMICLTDECVPTSDNRDCRLREFITTKCSKTNNNNQQKSLKTNKEDESCEFKFTCSGNDYADLPANCAKIISRSRPFLFDATEIGSASIAFNGDGLHNGVEYYNKNIVLIDVNLLSPTINFGVLGKGYDYILNKRDVQRFWIQFSLQHAGTVVSAGGGHIIGHEMFFNYSMNDWRFDEISMIQLYCNYGNLVWNFKI